MNIDDAGGGLFESSASSHDDATISPMATAHYIHDMTAIFQYLR